MSLIDGSVTGIDHVGIAVRDLDGAIDFYVQHFPCRVASREQHTGQGVEEAMLRSHGDTGTGVAIQLLASMREGSVIDRFLQRHGPGIQQIALRVTDIEAVTTSLTRAGLTVTGEQPIAGGEGTLVDFVHPRSTEGVLVELVQRDATESAPE